MFIRRVSPKIPRFVQRLKPPDLQPVEQVGKHVSRGGVVETRSRRDQADFAPALHVWAINENATQRWRSRFTLQTATAVAAIFFVGYGSTQFVVPPVPATPRVAEYCGSQTTSVPPPFPVTVASKFTIDRSWIRTPGPPLFVIVAPPVNLALDPSRTWAPTPPLFEIDPPKSSRVE